MKKTILTLSIIGIAVLALAAGTIAYAQSQLPPTPDGATPGIWSQNMGPFHMWNGDGDTTPSFPRGRGGGGMMGMWGLGTSEGYGPLHDYMLPAMAAALGLDPEEFLARHEAGETFWDIASAQGLSEEEAWALMTTARETALNQAVADGVLSQEQADWMLEHMNAMQGAGYGAGSGSCHGGGAFGPQGRGGGRGRWGGSQSQTP